MNVSSTEVWKINSSIDSSTKPEFDNQQIERTGVLDRTSNIIANDILEPIGISNIIKNEEI